MKATLIIDGNTEKQGIGDVLARLSKWNEKRGQRLLISSNLRRHIKSVSQSKSSGVSIFDDLRGLKRLVGDELLSTGIVVCLGGDGALLHTVRGYAGLELPFIGANLGSVGFNASASPDRLTETIEAYERGVAPVVEHLALVARQIRGAETVAESVALNDVVLQRESAARMLEIRLHRAGELILAINADGLIISTPTGSTAYNLSTGGPIVEPSLRAICVTGLGAHTLTSRPIVLAPGPPLEISSIGKRAASNGEVLIDGQERWGLAAGDRIQIEVLARPIRLINPPGHSYFETLRAKLHWAMPIRKVSA